MKSWLNSYSIIDAPSPTLSAASIRARAIPEWQRAGRPADYLAPKYMGATPQNMQPRNTLYWTLWAVPVIATSILGGTIAFDGNAGDDIGGMMIGAYLGWVVACVLNRKLHGPVFEPTEPGPE